MPIQTGSVVESIAGHDAGRFYVVVSVRLLEKPKRKSVKHIRKINAVLDLSSGATNKKLRTFLRGCRGESEGGNELV